MSTSFDKLKVHTELTFHQGYLKLNQCYIVNVVMMCRDIAANEYLIIIYYCVCLEFTNWGTYPYNSTHF